jgi:Amt family ammonium transporter
MSETIDYQASHDTLTGLSNREFFSKRLDALITECKSGGPTHALIYLDIDQFKVVNETSGHVAGDELLRHTTSVIRTVIRASDVGARLGSDEFGILLENISPERAEYIAERLRARLHREKFTWEPGVFTITSSIGLVLLNERSKDIYSVLANADDACYIAKELGGNRIQVYEDDESVFQQRRGEMEWISKIKWAIDEDRLRLYYQPIVPIMDSGKRHKCEILLRMRDSDDSLVMPADFLPAAERYNLMPAIDRWVVTSTFEAYSNIMETGSDILKGYIYCINLSGASMVDSQLLTFIRTEIERTRVPPGAFCFEVTETAAIGNISSASRFITDMREIGCTFSLDDFGSGFSSFSYLKNLPVDYLKIDGSFVKDMHLDPINHAMVAAINNLGKLMKIETIAEFVGNPHILEGLRDIGVDYAQGYELGKPAPLIDKLP